MKVLSSRFSFSRRAQAFVCPFTVFHSEAVPVGCELLSLSVEFKSYTIWILTKRRAV